MTVEEMIAKADEHLRQTFNQSAAYAQAWLMRADLELRLQERRSAFAATVVEKLNSMFKLAAAFVSPSVVPLASGDGFLITLSNHDSRSRNGDYEWGDVLDWAVNWTKDFADAGWKIRFKFGDIEACPTAAGQHEFWYMAEDKEECWKKVKKPMPYCCKCGAPRPVV